MEGLNAVLSDELGHPLLVSVCVIAGTAGVGKTSLALRWAHQVRDRFPDGQLYVNLRGYDPGTPVTAQEVLHRFLSALGVPAKAVPADPEAASALYRSLLAGRRVLVVLDNASSARQVRPLLPGSEGCLVIVTSRSRLSGLSVRDGARRLTLGTLSGTEAVSLLRTVTEGYRAEDDQEKLEELAGLCARLPLALRIAAERAASRPRMRLDDLIRDLRDESALWDALSVGDDEDVDAVRTVFAWSYRALTREAARLFRLLGLHPGREFGAPAVAALAGLGVSRAQHLLDALLGAHLLEQSAADRYAFHDLLRAYAVDQVQDEEPPGERAAARRRVLEWYLHSADAAQTHLNPAEAHIPLDPPAEGVTPATFVDYHEALAWYERERENLLAAIRVAGECGLDRITWQLPAVLRSVHMRGLSSFSEWREMSRIGLEAARRVGDRRAQGELLESLGLAHFRAHQLVAADEAHREALAIRRELGDALSEALSLNDLGLVCLRRRRLREAKEHFTRALAVYQEHRAVQWQAHAAANLALTAYELGQLDEAEERVRLALEICRQRDDRQGEGNALRIRSAVLRERGASREAWEAARSAVEIAREYRHAAAEGYWLIELAATQRELGAFGEALESAQRAATLQRRLGDRAREALAWQSTGEAYQGAGRHAEAVDFHRGAAVVFRELDDRWQWAVTLDGLAEALVGTGAQRSADAARGQWEEAERLLGDFDDPRADRLRRRIRQRLSGG